MDIKQKVKDTVDNVRDATNETLHRSTAEAEHVRRGAMGDHMAMVEKIKSGANEAKNLAQAEIDKAKREARK